jgi:hypothetical protein
MTIDAFINTLKQSPTSIAFTDTIAVIDAHYQFQPTGFTNGNLHNEAGQNSGSCKLFSFAKWHQLNKEETLACFGAYYFIDVLQNPSGEDHQNIRNFIKKGWEGIVFENEALTLL